MLRDKTHTEEFKRTILCDIQAQAQQNCGHGSQGISRGDIDWGQGQRTI